MSSLAASEAYQAQALERLIDQALIETLVGANPAAGAEWIITVPGGEVWEIISIFFNLVTDATVANRRTTLVIDDGTNVLVNFGANTNHPASTNLRTTFCDSGVFTPNTIAGTRQTIGIGKRYVFGGWRIGTLTDNLQAADDYGAPTFILRRTSPSDIARIAASLGRELIATLQEGD